MAQEFVVTDTIVLRVALDWQEPGPSRAPLPSLQTVTGVLAQFPRLKPGTVFLLSGRAHRLLHPHPANPDQGTQWTPKLSGGGILKLVLARVDQPAQRVELRYEVYRDQGVVRLDQPASWLVAEFNPTTILIGNNILPVTLADAETGEIDELPSSSPHFLIKVYRMAFELLGQLAQQAGLISGELFSPWTLQAIQDGDVHVVRSQWAGYLPADVPAFLQTFPVLFQQTIADGPGIIQLATHLGLRFKKYSRKATRALTGVILQKLLGNKLQYSLEFYNKAARVAQMRQGRTLIPTEVATVQSHVRFDVTVHSAGVLTLVGEAIRQLRRLLPEKPQYFGKFAPRFLDQAPRPTVWWLERAVWILSHTTTPDHARQSFGSWLLPQMIREVLRLDTIATFTGSDLHALLRKKDHVVAAWRHTERLEDDDWAGALASAGNCSKAWIYERRKQLLAKYKIDIAFPFAFYRDLIFFGPNSLTPPQVRAALNAALARRDAATNLRLRQRAVKEFDHCRRSVIGASVSSPLLAMSPKVVIPSPAREDHDELGEDLTLPSVAPRETELDASQPRGSKTPPRVLNLRAALPSKRADVLPTPPATPVAKSSGRDKQIESPRIASVTPLVPGKGEFARRPSPGRGDVTVPTKKRLLCQRVPPSRSSLDLVAGPGPAKSSSATNWKQVVLHSARRDAPIGCRKRVIMVHRKPPTTAAKIELGDYSEEAGAPFCPT